MNTEFSFDVFLSHKSKDKLQVRRLAERLRSAGLRVWFDERAVEPGDNIPMAIERGLEASRTIVLCMSANAFDSGWVELERSTAIFRDPRNSYRRFIPLLLASCKIPDMIRVYNFIDFRQGLRLIFLRFKEKERQREYRIEKQSHCRSCSYYGICTKAKRGRTITRHELEEVAQRVSGRSEEPEIRRINDRRKARVEHQFGFIKKILGFGQFQLRGREGAAAEATIVATCLNVRKEPSRSALPESGRSFNSGNML
jgi:hypothetical protein